MQVLLLHVLHDMVDAHCRLRRMLHSRKTKYKQSTAAATQSQRCLLAAGQTGLTGTRWAQRRAAAYTVLP